MQSWKQIGSSEAWKWFFGNSNSSFGADVKQNCPCNGQAMPSWWLWKFVVQQIHVSIFHLAFFLQTSNEAMDLETFDSCRSEQWLTAVRHWKSCGERGRCFYWGTFELIVEGQLRTTCGSICFHLLPGFLTRFPRAWHLWYLSDHQCVSEEKKQCDMTYSTRILAIWQGGWYTARRGGWHMVTLWRSSETKPWFLK